MESIDALIDGIAKFKGAVIIISHNQHLIQAATNELWVINKGKVKRFDGDFADYRNDILSSFEDS
jgi:ATPase subunit of ABC transporter with duplicated ATPase domains